MSVLPSTNRSWRCRLLPLLFLGVGLSLSSQTAWAQAATGSIQGTITDPSGAVVPNAAVTVTNKDTGEKVILKTTGTGAYTSGPLLPGTYEVQVQASGFKTTVATYTVRVGTVSTGNLRLEVGAASTVVQVAGEAVQVNASQATVQDVLGRQQISELPVNGRNYLDLASLAPGVQIQDGSTFDPTKNGYSSISFGGRFGRTARVLVDGIDISDETVGTVTQNIPQSGIQEFQLQQSTLDLSTELTSSGAVNVTTRSGTNSFHGGGYFYGRSDQLSARIAPNQLDFAREQYGVDFGGPFIKNKLFFFGDWEYTNQPLANPVLLTAPFAALSGSYTSPFKDNMFLGRLDWKIRPSMTAFGRFSYEQNSSVRGFNPGVYQPFLNRDHTPVYAGGLDFTTGRFTHSFRFGYTKFHNEIVDGVAQAGAQDLAPGTAVIISPFFDVTCLNGGESYCSGTNILAPQETFQRNWQGKYDGTYIFGNHILRYGFTINSIIGGGGAAFFGLAPSVSAILSPGTQTFADSGTFTCPDGSTGRNCPLNYPVQTVLAGNGQGFFTEIPEFNLPAGGQYDNRFEWYVGDSWKARPNLTINYGLRYVRDTGRSDADIPAIPCSSVDPSLGFSCTGDLLNAWGPGLGGRVAQPNLNFAPQLGIAWDPTNSGKTVIRLGGGLYYENAIFNNVLFDRPARLQQGLFFGNLLPCANGQTRTVTFPTGETVTPTFCGGRIGQEASNIIAFQQAYQAATTQAGPQSNGSFVGNTLAEGVNSTGQGLFAPDYRTPFSWQMNAGVQHQFGKNSVLSVDFVRNIGLHFLLSIDQNHTGDARFLDTNAALAAISATNSQFDCGTGTGVSAINCSIAAGATIVDYANNGLDSGLTLTGGFPCGPGNCAFPGKNSNLGEMQMLFPIGRSTYDALLVSWRSNLTNPVRGIHRTSLIISYALSRFTSQATDQDFIPLAWDMNNPLRFTGPNALDRTSQLGIGAVMDFPFATQVSFATHWNTAPTQNLVLPQTGEAGEIFRTDWTGDGQFGSNGAGDVLPGTNLGSFGRSVKTGELERTIANYNTLYAGTLTPAGQTLVNAGLFSVTQLQQLQAVMPTLAAPVPGHIGLSPFFTFDMHLSWNLSPNKVWKSAPESLVIQPQVAFYNLFNFQNFDPASNLLSGVLQLACPTAPSCVAAGNVTGQTRGSRTNLINPGATSGVNWYGVPRQVEFGVKVTF
jgi:hypothetical protein